VSTLPQPSPEPAAERLFTAAELREALRVQERCMRETMLAHFAPEAPAVQAAPVRHLTLVRP
jgi:hypothetical protein